MSRYTRRSVWPSIKRSFFGAESLSFLSEEKVSFGVSLLILATLGRPIRHFKVRIMSALLAYLLPFSFYRSYSLLRCRSDRGRRVDGSIPTLQTPRIVYRTRLFFCSNLHLYIFVKKCRWRINRKTIIAVADNILKFPLISVSCYLNCDKLNSYVGVVDLIRYCDKTFSTSLLLAFL